MIIFTLWGQRRESYPGEYGKELLTAWDENTIDANTEGFDNDVRTQKKLLADDFLQFEIIEISIPDHQIDICFRPKKASGTVQVPIDKITEAGI